MAVPSSAQSRAAPGPPTPLESRAFPAPGNRSPCQRSRLRLDTLLTHRQPPGGRAGTELRGAVCEVRDQPALRAAGRQRRARRSPMSTVPATAATAPAAISPREDRHDSTDQQDWADSSEPVLSQEPAEIS